ncbi:MAG: hypothetical protein AAGA48_03535 [Myxococcota bacterium]
MTRLIPALTLLAVLVPMQAEAHRPPASPARNVGLGVVAGANLADASELDLDTSFSWGFFVDIPLIETFYVTPAATVYELRQGDTRTSHTDLDLNFKFVVPIKRVSLGLGPTVGVTTGLDQYRGHFGGLGFLSVNVVSNVDLMAMGQFKVLATGDNRPDINNTHVFGGVRFRF